MVLVSSAAFASLLGNALKSASSAAGSAALNAAGPPLIASATKSVPGLSHKRRP
jgi:hypothetical protein